MEQKVKEEIKTLITTALKHVATGETRLHKQRKPTAPHILETLGSLCACIRLLLREIEILHHMHVGLERANLEFEDMFRGVIDKTANETAEEIEDEASNSGVYLKQDDPEGFGGVPYPTPLHTPFPNETTVKIPLLEDKDNE